MGAMATKKLMLLAVLLSSNSYNCHSDMLSGTRCSATIEISAPESSNMLSTGYATGPVTWLGHLGVRRESCNFHFSYQNFYCKFVGTKA